MMRDLLFALTFAVSLLLNPMAAHLAEQQPEDSLMRSLIEYSPSLVVHGLSMLSSDMTIMVFDSPPNAQPAPAATRDAPFGVFEVGDTANGELNFHCTVNDICVVNAVDQQPSEPFHLGACAPAIGTAVRRGGVITCSISFSPQSVGTFTDVALFTFCFGDFVAPGQALMVCEEERFELSGTGIEPPEPSPIPSPTPQPVEDFCDALCAAGGAAASAVVTGAIANAIASQVPQTALAAGFSTTIVPAAIAALAGQYLFPVDQLIVQLPKGVKPDEAKQLVGQVIVGAELIGHFSPVNAYLFRFRGIDAVEDINAKFQSLDQILSQLSANLPSGSAVLKNYLGTIEGERDLDNLPSDLKRAYDLIGVQQAWDKLETLRLRPVRVAIIDTGIDGLHPEFSDVNISGISYMPSFEWHRDYHGHGTWISGIIGAENGQGRMNGMLSAANENYEIRIYQVDIAGASSGDSDNTAGSPLFTVLDAIRRGVSEGEAKGAVVVNISLGWDVQNIPTQAELDLVYALFEQTIAAYPKALFVTSAGNKGITLSTGQSTHAPGGVVAENNITVASANLDGSSLADFSNHGSAVDLAAPGVDIFTTDTDGSYLQVDGTSFSAAIVSGAAAMTLSVEPRLKPKEIKALLAEAAQTQIANGEGELPLLNLEHAIDLAVDKRDQKSQQALWLSLGLGAAAAVGVFLGLLML